MNAQPLSDGLIGQPEVTRRLTAAIERLRLDALPKEPVLGRGLFAGPTGTGKTEAAKLLHRALVGDAPMGRIDCSEFSDTDGVRLLLGNAGGTTGRLEQVLRQSPRGVILFDEIEKGSREMQLLLLQIVDEGVATTGSGKRLDFSAHFVVATSNLGSAEIVGRDHLPFRALERHVAAACEKHLRPELLGRLGTPYVFRPLGREEQESLTRRQVDKLLGHSATKGRRIEATAEAVAFLTARGFSRRFGARSLFQFINAEFGDAVVRSINAGHGGSGSLVPVGDQLEVQP